MNEEKIFGPFTLRQFIYVVVAIAAIYYAYNNLSQSISIPLGIVIAIGAYTLIKNSPAESFDESSIRRKRSELGHEKFQQWVRRKQAMIEAQIAFREQRGLPADPAFTKTKDLLTSIEREG